MLGWLAGCTAGLEESTPPARPTSAILAALQDPSLSRTGAPPDLLVEPPSRTDSGCGYALDIQHLFALSTPRLEDIGAGRVSPLVVLEDV